MPFNIAIIDYEMGNLKSIYKCLKHLNVDTIITDDSKVILDTDGVILPGVGAFGDAMRHLKEKNLIPVITQIVNEKKPLFGICLGQQLIFSKSYEMGEHEGLNLIKGDIIPFDISKVDKIPQIGWNSVEFLTKENFLIQGIPNNSYFYFVHSFYADPENKDLIIGLTKYGEVEYCSIIGRDNIIATQFHPEKSSKYGIQIYKNFIKYCRK
ncbi:MAG: imidazole glycerol phosphate synthase subunit HisH [Candidatus Hodarchaeota archaeon]